MRWPIASFFLSAHFPQTIIFAEQKTAIRVDYEHKIKIILDLYCGGWFYLKEKVRLKFKHIKIN